MRTTHDAEKLVREKWRLLKATMDERQRRLWAGAEAGAIGFGGVAAVARATGLAISTVRKGRDEGRDGAKREDVVVVRRSAGPRPFEELHPEIWPALEKLVDPVTRGDPESPLRWTCKSTHVLASELFAQHNIRVSDKTVAKLLREHGYSLQAPNKAVEGKQHPDRDAQFKHINATAERCLDDGVPVISVEWRPLLPRGTRDDRGTSIEDVATTQRRGAVACASFARLSAGRGSGLRGGNEK